MKNKIALLILFFSLCFSACKKDDGITASTSIDIAHLNFSDYGIVLTSTQTNIYYGAYDGRVLYDNGKFKMWYSNSYGNDQYDIGYAESNDGIIWTVVTPHAITQGDAGSWDSYGVHVGGIIKDGNTYKLYYCGQSTANDVTTKKIGYATSTDGLSWTKHGLITASGVNIYGYNTDVINVNGIYYLYYGNSTEVGVITSLDGINWTKSSTMIISASQSWEGTKIWSCSVIYEDNKFKMLYMTQNFNYFGYAESSDGINWTKSSRPIWGNATSDIRGPFIRKVNNNYYLYYSTQTNNYISGIGVAVATVN